jgi:hypothetical protein
LRRSQQPYYKGLTPELLVVVEEELLESGVRAQRSKIRAAFDGGEIAAAKSEGLLHLSQSLFFLTFSSIGSA